MRSIDDLYAYTVAATDGSIGQVKDCYFDDRTWTARFLVVQTGAWLANRKVLISPIAIHDIDWTGKVLPASVTREQVRKSPDVDTNKPVSRQHEVEQFGYYGYPYYWGQEQLWGDGLRPGMSLAGYGGTKLPIGTGQEKQFVDAQMELHRQRGDDPDLRSCRAIDRYHIRAIDGDIGHVAGVVVDDETWSIRYLVVNTSDWWLGHQVLIAPPWIADIAWLDATVSLDLTRQAVRGAPAYRANALPNRQQERDLYAYYGRPA